MKAKIVRLFKIIKKHYQMGNISDSSAVLVYYILLSSFPMLMLVGNIFKIVSKNSDNLLYYVKLLMPSSIYDVISPLIQTAFSSSNGGISIGLIVVIWSSSRAVAAFQRAVNRTYGFEGNQSAIINRLFSFLFLLVLLTSLVLVVFLISISQFIFGYFYNILNLSNDYMVIFRALKLPTTLIVLFIILTAIYYFVPSYKIKLRYVWVGSLTSVLGFTLLSNGFSIYVKYFFHSINAYKTLGIFVLVMFWLYLIGMTLLFGAVMNASIQEYKTGNLENNITGTEVKDLLSKYKKR
ncbi:YihY family inner membrane protein [Lactobacillus sp. S2-2]|uniref:YihY/virulence factor BrkB family protein n=1 Tax=Lactobacillus sp. S2-2 TaxID=2692917 RepID=UPI001F31499B|nr:YihY/virulence factor BrkB family protein [Lactobacillus sp. S2-2]MCF6514821.1 YihY family inner membrane protein [Lactobacillus sp. S2-2]